MSQIQRTRAQRANPIRLPGYEVLQFKVNSFNCFENSSQNWTDSVVNYSV